jgi:hypothetical protein
MAEFRMPFPRQTIDATLGSLRQNRRLQTGIALIALLACIEGGMRWNDHLTNKLGQLQQMRGELRNLRNQSRNEVAMRKSLDNLRQARQDVDSRLWVVSSDAVGQARIQDWLNAVLKRTGIASQSLKISAAQPVNERDSSGTPQGATPSASSSGLLDSPGLRQIHATMSIGFTPVTLEQILGEIEGGDAYADVQALTISQRDRHAELTIRILMRVDRSQSAAASGEIKP